MAYKLTKNDWELADKILASVEYIANTAIGLSVVKSDMKPMYKLMALGMISGGFKRLKIIRRGAMHDMQAKQGIIPTKFNRSTEEERQKTQMRNPT